MNHHLSHLKPSAVFIGVKSGDIEYNAMRQVNQELAMVGSKPKP